MGITTRAAMAALLIAALAAPFVHAQTAQSAPGGEKLALQKARTLALARSAALGKAELAVDAAALSATSEGYSSLPTIGASASGGLSYSIGQKTLAEGLSASLKASASETLYDGGKSAAKTKKADLATEAARQSLRSTRVSLIGTVDAAFYAVLEDEASVEAAQSDLDAAQLRLSIAKAKVDAGTLAKSGYLQTEAEAASYGTTLMKAKKGLASAQAKLASITGVPASTALEEVDFSNYDDLVSKLAGLDEAGVDALAKAVRDIAAANSPSLSSYALAARQARLAVEIAKKAYLPTVTAGLSQGLGAYGASSGLSLGSTSLSIGASMSLDLWNTKNAVDSAQVAAKQSELEASDGQASLELDLDQAVYEWIASAGAIGPTAKALEYAQSNYENVLEKYKLNAASTSDLSTAEALVSGDRTSLINARYAFLASLSTLKGLAGLEDSGAIETAALATSVPAAGTAAGTAR
jgi:Outer membrane protein